MIGRFLLKVVLACCTTACLAGTNNESRVEGTISGRVLTEDGLPASDFKVCLQVRSRQSWLESTSTSCPSKTDDAGEFTIEHLKAGTYGVLATNERKGYTISNQSPGQSVIISKKDLSRDVIVNLRKKGAVVLASFTDKASGNPIQNVNFQYEGVDCESAGSTSEAEQYVLSVPTDCGVILVARAKGYRGWVYTDPDSPRPVLRLRAGERREFEIQLEPIQKETLQP